MANMLSCLQNCVVPECSNGSYEKCDFDLFLSFIGTDKDGNYMKSAAMRMSQFQRYSLTDVYHFQLIICISTCINNIRKTITKMEDISEQQPYSEHEVDHKIKKFVDLLQESNTTSKKFEEIEKFQNFMLSRKNFLLTDSQIDLLYEGNEEENLVGLCQFAGRKKYLEKYVKRSSISALMMIYKLMTESGTLLFDNRKNSTERINGRTLCRTRCADVRKDEPRQAFSGRLQQETTHKSCLRNHVYNQGKILFYQHKQKNRKFLALKQFLHEGPALDKIEEEIVRREQVEGTGEQPKQTDEKPQTNLEPSAWDTVKDTDLFVLEEIGGNNLLENVEADGEWKSTFIDPIGPEAMENEGRMLMRTNSVKIKESPFYIQSLKSVSNLEAMLPQLHIQSSQFNPKNFLESLHRETSIDMLKRGKNLLSTAEAAAGESEKHLILQNVHHFAMSKRVLEEVNNAMFGQKVQAHNIYIMIKDAKENFHNFASKVRQYLDPAKKKAKELEELDRDMQFIQSLDDFFELNAQIVKHIENQDIKKFVEYYKEYERKVQSYKSLNQVSSLIGKIEFIVKKAKSLILTKLLEEDKVSFDKLEESLKHLRELGSSNVLILPLLQERKNRLLYKINDTLTANMQNNTTKSRSQKLTLSINLLKNKELNENTEDAILREKVKQCIDVQEPVDSFVSYAVGKREVGLEYKIDETYIAGLHALGREMVEEVKIINQIVSVYTAKGDDKEQEEISTFKLFGEIVIYLCTAVDKIFLKQLTKDLPFNSVNRSISVIQQITRMTVFPQDPLLFGDRTFAVAIFLADLERQLTDILPESLVEKISELTSKFTQAYVNKVFFDMYVEMNKLDLKADLTLATLAHNEEPLFMNEFKSMVFEGLEDIARFLDRMRKNMINGKPIMQALRMPLQNIIIHLLVLTYKESEDLVSRIKQQQQIAVGGTKIFEFDESVSQTQIIYAKQPKMLLIYVMALERLKTCGLKEIGYKFHACFKNYIVTESMSFQKTADPIESLTSILFKVLYFLIHASPQSIYDKLTKSTEDLLNHYVILRSNTLMKYIQQLLKPDASNIGKSTIFGSSKVKQSQCNPFGQAEDKSEKPPLPSRVHTRSIILALEDQMLFEEDEYDKKLLYESTVPFSELRLPLYDIIKYLVYTQCEIYEYAEPYYTRLTKKLCHNVLLAYEKFLASIPPLARNVGLQILFEFEFLLEIFKGEFQKEQEETVMKCKKVLWKAIGAEGKKPEAISEENALTDDEIAEKKKQLKVLKYKSGVTLQSFLAQQLHQLHHNLATCIIQRSREQCYKVYGNLQVIKKLCELPLWLRCVTEVALSRLTFGAAILSLTISGSFREDTTTGGISTLVLSIFLFSLITSFSCFKGSGTMQSLFCELLLC
eukprot:TRINITY_DN70892_c1_g1_i1.p1 TRINITY_DN70892_c1_g1~~TRINITY_DN70892_c1_g1_i1.p1  ORF type:complete len:1387 (-),score=162.12 TRINITY_DN70892_c1_g1_i1:4251-8411(-)